VALRRGYFWAGGRLLGDGVGNSVLQVAEVVDEADRYAALGDGAGVQAVGVAFGLDGV
jgi:hypothetical protein